MTHRTAKPPSRTAAASPRNRAPGVPVWFLLVVFAALFVLPGCRGPFRATVLGDDTIYKTEKVILLDRGLNPWIWPKRVQLLETGFEINEQGHPQVRLLIANNRAKPTSMELRTLFKDETGLLLHQTAWRPAIVSGNATHPYLAVSPEKNAVDYQVQIKTLK